MRLAGWHEALALAQKQVEPEVDLEAREDLAHGRLGQPHALRRGGDRAGFHELDIGLELAVSDPHDILDMMTHEHNHRE